MHGNVSATNVVWVLVASALITALFAPIALRMYHKER
jgi:ABC-2 type transport system permease protein